MTLLEATSQAIDRVKRSLTEFDQCSESVKEQSSRVAELEAESQRNTNDISGDLKNRIKVHRENSSALVLGRADLISLQSALDSAKAETLRLGKIAAEKLFELFGLLKLQRVANLEKRIAEEFDFSRILILQPRDFANAHKAITDLEKLLVATLRYEMTHSPDAVINALRRLDQVFAQLRLLAESEPGLNLNLPTSEPVAELQPIAA